MRTLAIAAVLIACSAGTANAQAQWAEIPTTAYQGPCGSEMRALEANFNAVGVKPMRTGLTRLTDGRMSAIYVYAVNQGTAAEERAAFLFAWTEGGSSCSQQALDRSNILGKLGERPRRSVAGRQPPRRGPASFSRYAKHIETKADSVMLVLNAANASLQGFEGLEGDAVGAKLATVFGEAGRRMSVLAGDFDAVVPPAEFERLHAQLVQPLQSLANMFKRWSGLMSADCASERAAGMGCDELARKADASRTLVREMGTIATPLLAYGEARERAQRMLKEQGVTLADPTFQFAR